MTKDDFSLPKEFVEGLDSNPVLKAYFNDLPPSHQKEYLKYIWEGKDEEAKATRIAKTLTLLRTKTGQEI